MPRRIQKPRTTDATRPHALPAPLTEESLAETLRRMEEKQSSRPPPPPAGPPREVPFERLLRDFVSEVSRKRGTPPP